MRLSSYAVVFIHIHDSSTPKIAFRTETLTNINFKRFSQRTLRWYRVRISTENVSLLATYPHGNIEFGILISPLSCIHNYMVKSSIPIVIASLLFDYCQPILTIIWLIYSENRKSISDLGIRFVNTIWKYSWIGEYKMLYLTVWKDIRNNNGIKEVIWITNTEYKKRKCIFTYVFICVITFILNILWNLLK